LTVETHLSVTGAELKRQILTAVSRHGDLVNIRNMKLITSGHVIDDSVSLLQQPQIRVRCSCYLWSPYVTGQTIYIFILSFVLSSSFFFSSPNLSGRRLDVCHTSTHGVALECRSETCCMWLAGNAGHKKLPCAHHRTTLSGNIFATKTRIDNWKKLLSSNISSTCPHNMVNFGLLAAEIDPVVWGTLANFNSFRVFAALLHGSQVVSVSQTLRC